MSLWDTFSRAQNASLAMPLSSPLVEYIQLGSLYASVVCVAKGRDTSIVEKCCDWAFSVLTPHLASSLERGDADAVSTYVELACAAALPLSDLLSCHEAVSCLARSVTAWVKCLTALNMKSGEAAWASLVSLFNVCCRFCCLFAQVEAAVNDESLALACEVAWKMCMTFLIQFADQIDTLGQKLTIEKLSSLRKHCQYALHSLLQYITSHPNLGKFADEAMYMLILASVYSMRISFENQMPVIIECICNKTKYSTAARTSAQKLLGAVKESNSIMISTGIDFLGAFVSRDTATSLINCNKVEALCGIFHA